MITSGTFDYVNLLDKAADASAKRSTILANNLANATTPNYKRKDIDFSKTLMDEVTKLAAQNQEEEDERVYFPRSYGLQYGVKYGSLPNYADVPEGFLRSGELIPEVDEDNVGNLVKELDLDNLRPKIYTEYEGLSYRIDKNNVDPDTENVELASEQIKYQVLTSSITQDFQQMKSVLQ